MIEIVNIIGEISTVVDEIAGLPKFAKAAHFHCVMAFDKSRIFPEICSATKSPKFVDVPAAREVRSLAFYVSRAIYHVYPHGRDI
jgi:hypothetical protein